jgi:hypothetical protein
METENNISERSACWACGAGIPREDNYCGKCGQGQGRFVHWYYRHTGAVFLSLAAGPFALYFVWRSPVMSRCAKWGYTAAVAAITWYAVRAVMSFWELLQSVTSAVQF